MVARKTVKRGALKPRRGAPWAARNDATRVGVRELRQNLSVYLDRVKNGEALTVTEHGAVVALLRPPTPAGQILDRLVADGRAVAPSGTLAERAAPRRVSLQPPMDRVLDDIGKDRV
jgi:antitoxin (DNA-binding transcriptional repressor) of toxin-antitoxin stability system